MPIRKKSGNLSYAPRVCVCVCENIVKNMYESNVYQTTLTVKHILTECT